MQRPVQWSNRRLSRAWDVSLRLLVVSRGVQKSSETIGRKRAGNESANKEYARCPWSVAAVRAMQRS